MFIFLPYKIKRNNNKLSVINHITHTTPIIRECVLML